MDKLDKNLANHKESNGVLISIKALTIEFFKDAKTSDLAPKMAHLLQKFQEYDLVSTKNLKSAMEGINQCLVGSAERELYELIDKQDELTRKIKAKQDEIRGALKISFETAENLVINSEISCKNEVLNLLNNAIIKETRMLWILKESSQNAFLTTIENGVNIAETIAQIAKNMTFSAINEGEFSSKRAVEISKTIITSAAEVANEGHIYAKELISAAVIGTKDGLESATIRLKDEAKFAPDELVNKNLKELKNIEQEFIFMLKELENTLEAPAKDEIKRLLETSIDSTLARLKRISEQASAGLSERLEELRQNPNIAELINGTNERLEKLKSAFEVIKTDINVNEKLENIKKELEELEKRAEQKFGTLNLKDEAKKMGDRAYKAAKELLNSLKKDSKSE